MACLKDRKSSFDYTKIMSLKLYLPKNEFIVIWKFKSFEWVVSVVGDWLGRVVVSSEEKKSKKN